MTEESMTCSSCAYYISVSMADGSSVGACMRDFYDIGEAVETDQHDKACKFFRYERGFSDTRGVDDGD